MTGSVSAQPTNDKEPVRRFLGALQRPMIAPILIAAAALVVRILWIAIVDAQPVSDFLFYYLRAQDLASGNGYQINGHPTAFWPPGYPAFLATLFWVTGPSLLVAKTANAVLWAGSAVAAYLLGTRAGGPLSGTIAGMFVALYPDFVVFSGLMASENLYVALVLWALVVALPAETDHPSTPRIAVGGLLLGLAVLVRGVALPLLAALVVVLIVGWRRRGGIRAATVLVIAAALTVSPWVVRNVIVMGAPVLSTNVGMALWWGANPAATGGYPLTDGSQGPSNEWTLSLEGELEQNRHYMQEALRFITSEPGRWLRLAPQKLQYLFNVSSGLGWSTHVDADGVLGGDLDDRELAAHEARVVTAASAYYERWGGVAFLLAWSVGGFGLVACALDRRRTGLALAALIGASLLFHATFSNGQARYLVGIAPLLGPGIGYTVARSWHRGWRGSMSIRD